MRWIGKSLNAYLIYALRNFYFILNKIIVSIYVTALLTYNRCMDKNAPATRKDIDEILSILKEFMSEVSIKFQSVDERFDQVDKRFDAVDKRFNKVDKHFDEVDKRFDKVGSRLDKIEKMIEPSNASLNNRLTKVETDTALLKKVATL